MTESKETIETFLKEHDGMIMRVVNRFYSPHVKCSRDDLKQEASIAAMRAIELFDKEKSNGAKLTSYVYKAMFRTCRDYVSANIFDLYYSRSMQKKEWKERKELGLSPEQEYVQKSLDFNSVSGSGAMAHKMDRMQSGTTGNETLRDIIPASGDASLLDSSIKREQIEILQDEIGKLPWREASVIKARMDGHNFSDIGINLGVSRQRAHQLYTKAFQKLDMNVKERLSNEILI